MTSNIWVVCDFFTHSRRMSDLEVVFAKRDGHVTCEITKVRKCVAVIQRSQKIMHLSVVSSHCKSLSCWEFSAANLWGPAHQCEIWNPGSQQITPWWKTMMCSGTWQYIFCKVSRIWHEDVNWSFMVFQCGTLEKPGVASQKSMPACVGLHWAQTVWIV